MVKNMKANLGKKVKVMPIYMTQMGFQKYELSGMHYTIRLLQNPQDGYFVITTENDDMCKELPYEYSSLTKEDTNISKVMGTLKRYPRKLETIL